MYQINNKARWHFGILPRIRSIVTTGKVVVVVIIIVAIVVVVVVVVCNLRPLYSLIVFSTDRHHSADRGFASRVWRILR